jgi:hypothetical protein
VLSFPALGLFRNGEYIPYEGDLNDEMRILVPAQLKFFFIKYHHSKDLLRLPISKADFALSWCVCPGIKSFSFFIKRTKIGHRNWKSKSTLRVRRG